MLTTKVVSEFFVFPGCQHLKLKMVPLMIYMCKEKEFEKY